jgi:putative alpha-1,2-mannosidase
VPHDPQGLIGLFGGAHQCEDKLDQMMALPPTFNVGTYGDVIHEMTEMEKAPPGFGQYAHSNQPVHSTLFLYGHCGCQSKLEHSVSRVLSEMYSSHIDGFPGDEDNGEMAAWYVLASIGLFPSCPGDGHYMLLKPHFRQYMLLMTHATVPIAPSASTTSSLAPPAASVPREKPSPVSMTPPPPTPRAHRWLHVINESDQDAKDGTATQVCDLASKPFIFIFAY